jgi:hypothetical protein
LRYGRGRRSGNSSAVEIEVMKRQGTHHEALVVGTQSK